MTRHSAPVMPQLASPFAPTPDALQSIVWADLTGGDVAPLTRAAAMAIPAVARLRHLIVGTLARCPLRVLDRDQLLATQPGWTSRTDGQIPPYHRTLWTVDDHIFTGWSLWRAGRGAGRELLDAVRIPLHRWETDQAGRIMVDGEYVTADEVILIPGPHEGILNFGAAPLRRCIANLDAAANAARNPSAYLELHYTGDTPLADTEVDALIGRWAKARRGEYAGVSYTNKWLEVKEHGTHEAQLLIEGRNADAVDVARLISAPAAMADATNAGASLTYETSEGRNSQFIDYGLGLYAGAIEARLSMDDVVSRGHRTAFDMSVIRDLAPAPTGAPTDD